MGGGRGDPASPGSALPPSVYQNFGYTCILNWTDLFQCLFQEFMNSPLYPVMIISYEMFLRSVEEVRNIKFGLVICDEAHRLKNTTIKTAMVSFVPFCWLVQFSSLLLFS